MIGATSLVAGGCFIVGALAAGTVSADAESAGILGLIGIALVLFGSWMLA